MSDCIFCKIINGEIPSDKVYEDENVIAILDINPVAPVHVLVIPKEHIPDMNSVTEDNIKYLNAVTFAIQRVVEKLGIKDKGYRVINNCGRDGGQTINHLHFHIIGGTLLGEKLL